MAEERTLSLKQLATEINRAYQQIIDGEKKSIEYATEISEMLIAAKKQHGEHGKWLDWLKAECPQIAETTAALYMRKSATRGRRATWPPPTKPPSLYYISHYIFYILEEGQVCLRALLSGKTSK